MNEILEKKRKELRSLRTLIKNDLTSIDLQISDIGKKLSMEGENEFERNALIYLAENMYDPLIMGRVNEGRSYNSLRFGWRVGTHVVLYSNFTQYIRVNGWYIHGINDEFMEIRKDVNGTV